MRLFRVLLALLAGCASAPGPVEPPRPTATPISTWRLPGDGCEPWWMQPAIDCGRNVYDHDGCRWRCTNVLEKGARQ